MKIKLHIEVFGFPVGSIIEVSEPKGDRLVKSGNAKKMPANTKTFVPKAEKPTIENKAMSAK